MYNLTAASPPPSARLNAREFRADAFKLAPTLPQLPDARLISRVARELRRFEAETDASYPDAEVRRSKRYGFSSGGADDPIEVIKHRAPAKLCAVFSHFYTPSTMRGLHSLKGRDRVVGRLLHDALKSRHDVGGPARAAVPSLATVHDNTTTSRFDELDLHTLSRIGAPASRRAPALSRS